MKSEPRNPQEMEAYINGFYDAMALIKQQENQTINATNNLISKM